MSAKEIMDVVLTAVGNNWEWGLVIILSIVEITKIKINPWTALINWIGKIMLSGIRTEMASMKEEMTKEVSAVKTAVGEVRSDMTRVEEELIDLKTETQEDKAKAARNRILVCADEVYQGKRHSKEYFDHILDDITFYKQYCEAHPNFKNEMTVMATHRIESIYAKCLEEHDFL